MAEHPRLRLRAAALAIVGFGAAVGVTACSGDDNQTQTYYADSAVSPHDATGGHDGTSGSTTSSGSTATSASTTSNGSTASSGSGGSGTGLGDDAATPDGMEPEASDAQTGQGQLDATETDASASDGTGGNADTTAPDGARVDATLPDAALDGSGADAAADAAPCVPYDAAGIDAAVTEAGLALVREFNCAGCHQTTPADAGIVLSGNPAGHNFNGVFAYAPNLTPDPATGLGCWTDPQIATAVLEGRDNQDASLCVMPQFMARFVDAGLSPEVAAHEIAQFLRTLPAAANPVPETNCAAAVDAGSDAGSGDGGAESGSDAGHSDAGDAAHDAADAGTDH